MHSPHQRKYPQIKLSLSHLPLTRPFPSRLHPLPPSHPINHQKSLSPHLAFTRNIPAHSNRRHLSAHLYRTLELSPHLSSKTRERCTCRGLHVHVISPAATTLARSLSPTPSTRALKTINISAPSLLRRRIIIRCDKGRVCCRADRRGADGIFL